MNIQNFIINVLFSYYILVPCAIFVSVMSVGFFFKSLERKATRYAETASDFILREIEEWKSSCKKGEKISLQFLVVRRKGKLNPRDVKAKEPIFLYNTLPEDPSEWTSVKTRYASKPMFIFGSEWKRDSHYSIWVDASLDVSQGSVISRVCIPGYSNRVFDAWLAKKLAYLLNQKSHGTCTAVLSLGNDQP